VFTIAGMHTEIKMESIAVLVIISWLGLVRRLQQLIPQTSPQYYNSSSPQFGWGLSSKTLPQPLLYPVYSNHNVGRDAPGRPS